jgi:DNA (cytosine-5)-methyltransferase 1
MSGTQEYAMVVGALIAPPQLTETVRKLLPPKWLKRGRNTCRYQEEGAKDEKVMAIHVSSEAALALNAAMPEKELPPALAELIRSKKVRWVGGVRLGSKSCLGGGLDWQLHVSEQESKKSIAAGRKKRKAGPQSSLFAYLELFAGIGGFRWALDDLGGRCVFASEIDRDARDTYCANFDEIPAGDITEIEVDDIPQHDMLTAGFPCQSFSKAGLQGGFKDYRGTLFFEITRLLAHCKPRTFLLENVPHLLELDGVIDTIVGALEEVGYIVRHRVINSGAWLAQDRNRLYFVGFRSDLRAASDSFKWPSTPAAEEQAQLTVRRVLEPQSEVGAECTLTESQWENIQGGHEWQKSPASRTSKLDGKARTLTSNYKVGYMMHSEFVFPEDGNDKPSKEDGNDMPSKEDGNDKPSKPRFYTRRECARLQGFPDSFKIDAMKDKNRFYFQIGNAVSPVVVKHIAAGIVATGAFGGCGSEESAA